MKHIQTLETRDMAKSLLNGGCGECQTSCQSACKTRCRDAVWQPGIFYDTNGAAGAYRMRPYRGDAVGADSISARGRPPHCTITKRRKP